jgi:xanthosine utilization system XapX-like protein
VPGAHALAPALGVGDLLFMGLVFGVAQRHALPYVRTVLLCLLGTALAGALAAACALAVPALPAIALCVLLGIPAARKVRPAERRTARWSMIIACSIALATIARNLLIRS